MPTTVGWARESGAKDAAFGTAIGTDGGDFDQNAVAVHRGADGVRRDEDIASQAGFQTSVERSGFGNREAEAVAMHGQPADQQVASLGGLRNSVALGVDLQQFAFADECVQTVREFAPRSPFTPSSRKSCLWLADF